MTKKILIVDDEENNIVLLEFLLKKHGYRYISADNGPSALAILEKEKIDLVLLDWQMPDMNGLEVCGKIKENPKTRLVPVIMISARSTTGDIQEGLDIGADDYATKPIVKIELLARIRAALRTGELQEKLDKELKGVAQIQRQLLPQALPLSDDFKASAFYTPCEDSGGDYYDAFNIDDRYSAYIIADVSSHGAPAMVAMAMTRSFLKMMASKETSPEAALQSLNKALFDCLPTSQHVTMFYSVYDRQENLLSYSSAGHPPPFYYKKRDNSLSKLEIKPGFPLKLIQRETVFPESGIKIEKGDKIFFYTDGYYEVANNKKELLDLEGMEKIIKNSIEEEKPLQFMVNKWEEFVKDGEKEDDVTLLLVEF